MTRPIAGRRVLRARDAMSKTVRHAALWLAI